MEERKQKTSGKRTVKYKDLTDSLEKQRQAIRKQIEEESRQKDDVYEENIHQIVSDLEAEAKIEEPVAESETRPSDQSTKEEMKEESDEVSDTDVLIEEISQKRKPVRQILLMLAALAVLVFAFLIHGGFFTKPDPPIAEDEKETLNLMDPNLRSMWLSNKEINEDYIGQIVFDSGLIDLPFVQAKDVYRNDGSLYTFYDKNGNLIEEAEGHTGNDVYIWTNWKTGEYDLEEEGGSVFLDYRNSLADQNLIIYGHHFARDYDPSGSKQFTPLDALLSQENYEDNKSLKLILDNEIRTYVVTNVFTISVYDEYEAQVIRTDMNEDLSGNSEPRFFNEFIFYMNRISRYDTGEALSSDDRILTLITCLEHQPEYRQVIVCKESGIKKYD